jgi:SPW repeat
MTHVKHWQDPVNAALGATLILSPWAAGFSGETAATANAVVVGVALIAASLGAMLAPHAWEEWTEAVLGLWMVMSPWVLAYSHHTMAMLVAVVGGIAILAMALWTLATDRDFSLPKSMLP